jgi:hypothetical protein
LTLSQAAKLARQPGGEFLSDKETGLCELLSITPMQVANLNPARLCVNACWYSLHFFCSTFSAKNSYCVNLSGWADYLVKVFFAWSKSNFITITAVFMILL